MPRMIDADARVTVQSFDVEHEEYNYTEMSVAEALDFATDEGCPPAVDAAPVRHGRWEEKMEHAGYVCCSVCHDCYVEKGWIFNKKWAWCPQCGARMDGGENNADG